jgi:hypothetical protein
MGPSAFREALRAELMSPTDQRGSGTKDPRLNPSLFVETANREETYWAPFLVACSAGLEALRARSRYISPNFDTSDM